MKWQKFEDRLPLVAALVVLIGVTGAAGDALAGDVAARESATPALEIPLDNTSSAHVAGS